MTEEEIKALEKDIVRAVDYSDLCRLCQNCMIEPRPECEECACLLQRRMGGIC